MMAWRQGMWKRMLTSPDCRYARAFFRSSVAQTAFSRIQCAALRRGSGQLQRHCDCGGIKSAGLQACQMRFCSPILMRHDVHGKELGGFLGFSNADFRGKMDDRGICDFSPEPLFAMRILACVFYLCDLIFHVAGDFAPAGATKGLCDRPLETFAVHIPVTGLCRNLWIRGTVWVSCG